MGLNQNGKTTRWAPANNDNLRPTGTVLYGTVTARYTRKGNFVPLCATKTKTSKPVSFPRGMYDEAHTRGRASFPAVRSKPCGKGGEMI